MPDVRVHVMALGALKVSALGPHKPHMPLLLRALRALLVDPPLSDIINCRHFCVTP